MSWSKTFISSKSLNNAEKPADVDQGQWDAAMTAARVIIDAGVVPEAETSAEHSNNPDNLDRDGKVIAEHATLRVVIGGHSGKGNNSIFTTVSEI